MNDNQRFIETFRDESRELLGTLEANLLELEDNPNDKELLSAVFRVMHTIKGSAAMFGLERISGFAHEVESLLSALRDGVIPLTRELADGVLAARDRILDMIESPPPSDGSALDAELTAFLTSLRNACRLPQAAAKGEAVPKAAGAPTGETTRPAADKTEQGDGRLETWHIAFVPNREIYSRGVNPFKLIAELTDLGEAVCFPEFTGVPPMEQINPADFGEGWNVFLTTSAGENRIRDVFIFVEGDCSLDIQCVSR